SGVTDPSVQLANGARMPLVGFGTWRLSGRSAYQSVRVALETGYRLIDTATMYGNEAEIGDAIRDSGIARDELFVTTKLPAENAGRARATLEKSVTALGVAQVDLWLLHWPTSDRALEPTWQEMLALRDDGLAAAVGVSNHSVEQIDRFIAGTGEAPVVN